jgi:hypothetical protein
MTIPTRALDEGNLPTYLSKQLGVPLTGDGELHLLAGMPLRPADQVSITKTNNAAPVLSGAISAAEIAIVQAALTKKKATKA